jgi:thymidylate synthase (FAD)
LISTKSIFIFQYVLPHVDNESREDIKETINFINEKYRNMRNRKVKKEDARCILPNAAVTQIIVSGEEFGWRHFIEQRTASDAQPEIREVALIVQDMLGDKNGSNLS